LKEVRFFNLWLPLVIVLAVVETSNIVQRFLLFFFLLICE